MLFFLKKLLILKVHLRNSLHHAWWAHVNSAMLSAPEHVGVRTGWTVGKLPICAWVSEQGWRLAELGVNREGHSDDGHGQGFATHLQVVFGVASVFWLGLLSSRCWFPSLEDGKWDLHFRAGMQIQPPLDAF